MVSLKSEVKWLHRELDEDGRGRNREFLRPWWSSAADVLTGVALKLPTHRLMRIDVGKRVKKVWGRSVVCGMSYRLWRDRWGSHHGRMCWLCVEWEVKAVKKKMGELTQKWEVHTLLCELTHFCVNRSLCRKESTKKNVWEIEKMCGVFRGLIEFRRVEMVFDQKNVWKQKKWVWERAQRVPLSLPAPPCKSTLTELMADLFTLS